MSMPIGRAVFAAILLLAISHRAFAGLVVAAWHGTTADNPGIYHLPPGTLAGTPILVNVLLDNGGTSLANQTWGANDFVEFRLWTGTYWFRSADAVVPPSTGEFTSDADGMLLTVPQVWIGENPNWDENGVPLSTAQDSLGPPYGIEGGWLFDYRPVDDGFYPPFWPISFSTGGSYSVIATESPALTTNWSISAVPESRQWLMMTVVIGSVVLGRFLLRFCSIA